MIKKILCTLALSLTTILSCVFPINATENTDVVSVNLYNNIYYGNLTSEDNGESTFTTASSSDTAFTITGKWSEKLDAFDGECTISYDDGSIQSVKYKNGLISKEVVTTYPDGTYQTFACNTGSPCKKIFTYSEDGTLIDLDWYHQCKSVKELIDSAIPSDYRALLSNPYAYVDIPLKVSGTIEAIYETSSQTYLKVADGNRNLYLFNYSSASIQPFFSTNIENVSVGDSLDIYGFFNKLNDHEASPLTLYEHALGYEMDFSDLQEELADSALVASVHSYSNVTDDDLDKEIPVFSAFYWETNKTDIDPINLTFSYDEICKYPYYYKDEDFSLTGKVVYENIDTANKRIVLLIQKQNSSEIYGVNYKTSEATSLLGKKVSCSGLGDGNNKISYYNSTAKTIGYALYPNIKASELKILSE